MCGIAAVFSDQGLSDRSKDILRRRGPNIVSSTSIRVHSHDIKKRKRPRNVFFYGTVLAMRGGSAKQPAPVGSDGSMLLFNGEAYVYNGKPLSLERADVPIIADALAALPASMTCCDKLAHVARRIQGPFAAIFYDAKSSKIAYCRDPRGRRSLLRRSESGFVVCISSCSVASSRDHYRDGDSIEEEVTAGVVFSCNVLGESQKSAILAPGLGITRPLGHPFTASRVDLAGRLFNRPRKSRAEAHCWRARFEGCCSILWWARLFLHCGALASLFAH